MTVSVPMVVSCSIPLCQPGAVGEEQLGCFFTGTSRAQPIQFSIPLMSLNCHSILQAFLWIRTNREGKVEKDSDEPFQQIKEVLERKGVLCSANTRLTPSAPLSTVHSDS